MKLLPHTIRTAIVRSFPKYEHSYTININKNVPHHYDYAQVIPKGQKYYIWFKKHNNLYMCYLISRDKKRVSLLNMSFDSKLTCGNKGTLLYGTYDNTFGIFYVEQLCIYKNSFVKYMNDRIYSDVFHSINNECSLNSLRIFLTEFILSDKIVTKQDMNKYINNINYDVYSIIFHSGNKRLMYRTTSKSQQIIMNEEVFYIEPQITSDVYYMYIEENGELVKYDSLLIPSYKTSVMMNRIFRRIKENDDIDLLEMSDDEEEFENVDEAKFITSDEYIPMRCKYNSSFKKWIPIEVDNISIPISVFDLAKKYKLYI
jgi:hypothetical protein